MTMMYDMGDNGEEIKRCFDRMIMFKSVNMRVIQVREVKYLY